MHVVAGVGAEKVRNWLREYKEEENIYNSNRVRVKYMYIEKSGAQLSLLNLGWNKAQKPVGGFLPLSSFIRICVRNPLLQTEAQATANWDYIIIYSESWIVGDNFWTIPISVQVSFITLTTTTKCLSISASNIPSCCSFQNYTFFYKVEISFGCTFQDILWSR